MASHPPAQCCTVGVKHEGEAKGELKKIDDFEAYFAPVPSTKPDRAIIILPDVIGHDFINVKLIADQFAANGFYVVIPDYLHGDPIPLNRPSEFDFPAWKAKHGTETVDPVVEATIKHVRETVGINKVGAVGYCFGGKYVARFLAAGKGVDVGYTAHPSFVDAEEVKAINGPFSIAAAITDQIFPKEKRHETEDILAAKDVAWQLSLYSDVEHGFAVRTDISIDKKRKAKELAFRQAVDWFNQYL